MKTELLKNLLLEDIRLHSELKGTKSFFLYPLVLMIATTVLSYLLFNFSTVSGHGIVQICLMIFFAFGIISGSFGLNASNYLERRFGDFGKLFSNALLLPIKLSNVFFMVALSDSIFYFGWFILPVFGGGTLGLLISHTSITPMLGLFFSSSLAFLLGISVSFLLTVLLTKTLKLFWTVFLSMATIAIVGFSQKGISSFPPYFLYANMTLLNTTLHILLIILLFFITGKILGNEYNSIRRKGKYNSYSFKKTNHFLFKDIIDLKRTHGLFAKPLFNVLIPSALLLGLLSSLNLLEGELSLVTKNLIFVAILLGTLSVNFFNVVISGDSFSYYVFLPTTLKDFVWPKMLISEIICSIQGTILLLIYAFANSSYAFLPASIIMLITFIFYTICLNFYLNGLRPNENSMNLYSLGWMVLLYLPFLIIGMLLPFLTSKLIIMIGYSIFLICLGYMFYLLGIKKWTKKLI